MDDYWNVPRKLIYRERENLNDFGIKESNSLNGRLFQLLSEQFLSANGADTLLLQCFNNAYYLCTIILLEDLPHLKVDKYENNLLMMNVQWNRDACAASFALAYEMLQVCEPKYQKDSLLLKAIYHRFRYNEWNEIVAAKTFYELIDKVEKDDIFLSKNEFAPRDIVEVIGDVGKTLEVTEVELHLYVNCNEYICERLDCLDDNRRRIYGADFIISRLNNYLRVTYVRWGYNPKTKRFRPAPNRIIDEIGDSFRLAKKVNPIEKAIEYYTEHYPTKEENDSKEKAAEYPHAPETDVLQASKRELDSKLNQQKRELQQQLAEKDKALQDALQTIEEYKQPVKELTAKQKIRMEFAVQLLLKSGLPKENLERENRNKSKVASLMSLLLGIGAQNIANYLIDRNYCPQEKDRDTILELDKLCLELGINAYLSTQQQGNKKD